MYESLKNILKSFHALSETDISNGLSCMLTKSFKKNDYLIKEGNTCDWIAFIHSGITRNYYISSKGEEVTYCLTFPHKFITAYSSFIQDEKTFENIHALSDVEALFLYKRDYQKLIKSSTAWLAFSNYFAEQSYVLMENRLLAIQMESAERRYRNLMQNNPEYIKQVPLKYIASYLGISQRHLSRLRKQVYF